MKLLFGVLFLLLIPLVWSLEEYSENLHISTLPNKDLSYFYRFSTIAENQDHFRIFPLTIRQLFDYGIEEFRFSMTTGFWRHEAWGIQPQAASPTGFLLLVKFADNMTEEDVSQSWSLVVKQINGFFCSSILEIDPLLTSVPSFIQDTPERYRYAHLSGEPLCTENIQPFLRLLPCKDSGLGTLIFSKELFNLPFHSLTIHAQKNKKDFSIDLFAHHVKNRLALLNSGGKFAQITGLSSNLKCKVAKEQRITHFLGQDYEASLPKDIEKGSFGVYDLTTVNATGNDKTFSIKMDREGLKAHVKYDPPLSLTIGQEQSDFRGGIMTTTITNNLDENIIASYFHMIPWQFRIKVDTLEFKCNRSPGKILKKSLDPALIQDKPLSIHLNIEVPKKSTCTLKLAFSNYLMIALSYPPDSNYGIFVPSPILSVNLSEKHFREFSALDKSPHGSKQIQLFGEPLLILLPVPDFRSQTTEQTTTPLSEQDHSSPSSSGVSSSTVTTNRNCVLSPPPIPPPPPPIPPRDYKSHYSPNHYGHTVIPESQEELDSITAASNEVISNLRKISIESSSRFASGNGLTPNEFRTHGKKMVDYIADYLENVHNRRVVPSIEPGYLRELIPTTPPMKAESFDRVMKDFETYVMPGVTHWQHPRFHAYFPAGNSFPSILANMLSDSLGCQGFSWAACPAMTELEMIVLDWFGRMIGLPEEFLPFTEDGKGGGVIQGSASECNFVALLAARFEIMKQLRQRFPFVEEGLLMSKLIAYCSKEAHSSVEKAAMIGMVKLRILETDSKFRLRGETLQAAITEDRHLGLIPFYVSTTLGTTSVCSFDVLSEIGPVCTENDLWLHVDAAYAGSAFICPEFRYLMSGIEHAMSFNTNPNKWMLVNFDCSTMWVKDRFKLTQALVVDPLYLQHSWMDKAIDYRHWGIPLSRRFRSLKLWFVIRMYGIEGLQNYIREHVRLAKKFEAMIRADDKFEIIGDVVLGLVCFRLKASDEANQNLLTKLNSTGRIHMVPASLSDRFVIRFCVCHEHANDRDIIIAYEIIKQTAQLILHEEATAEPIEENYELELLEEKEYGQFGNNSDSQSLPNKDTSIDSLNSYAPNTPPVTSNQQPAMNPTNSQEMTSIERRRGHTLAEKRSFLVRMVSDPKCYNPKIVRHLNMRNHKQTSQDLMRDRTMRQAIEQGSVRSRPARFSGSGAPMFGLSRSGSQDEYEEEGFISTVAAEPTGLQTPL